MNKITDIEYFQKMCSADDPKAYVVNQLKNYSNTIIKSETVEFIQRENLERILSCAMGKYGSVHITKSIYGEYYMVNYYER